MSGIHPEWPDSGPSDRSMTADALFRQEPDEEEEDEGGKKDDDDDDNEEDDNGGYSE
jgi:hypothetical protein